MKNLTAILVMVILSCAITYQIAESQSKGKNLNSAQRGYQREDIFQNHWLHPFWSENAFLWQPAHQKPYEVLRKDNWFPDQFNHSGKANVFANLGRKLAGSPLKTNDLVGDVTEAWVRHYTSGRTPGTDRAVDIATDNSGNVYVTGYSTSPGFGFDFYTIKYNSSGEQIWSARYDNNRSHEWATAICVDLSGNVYVTGYSNVEHITIKYDALGVEQWVSRHNELVGRPFFWHWPPAIPADLAVDRDGNVFVAGMNLTIKYDAFGKEKWVAPFDGGAMHSEGLKDLVLDDSGNVYVTGSSATIKYDTFGVQQWAADGGDVLAIDGSGNVYVTGSSSSAYATVKYDASGVQQWVARYEINGFIHATSIAVDDSNYIYVNGYSNDGNIQSNSSTIKYDSSGNMKWVATYDPGKIWSFVGDFGIAVDDSGNVYVAGGDFNTIKYNAMGIEQWVADYNGPDIGYDDAAYALALDDSGNVYVTGTCGVQDIFDVGFEYGNYATVKYNASGVEQWVSRYEGPGNSGDRPSDLAVDNFGNIYVTGNTEYLWKPAEDVVDYVTIKYDATGEQQWVASYDGGNTLDRANANAVDDAGNVYVTGYSDGDYLTIKYNSAGIEEWVARFDGQNPEGDIARDIAIDKAGNVYVTGSTATIKYNAFGVQQWATNGNGNVLAIDHGSNIYISGTSYEDCVTIKYDSSGSQRWYARYNGPGNGWDYPTGIAIDDDGNVYVTGSSTGTDDAYDYATVKYDSSGSEQWVARYQSTMGSWDYARGGLVIDKPGNVYVTGSSGQDYVTIKYNSQGVEQWIARYNSPGDGYDSASRIVIDDDGNVYVTGSSWEPDAFGSSSCATIKYDSLGTEQWIARYQGPGNLSIEAIGLVLDNRGSLYVTGSSGGMITTIKYTETGTPVGVSEPGTRADKFDLAQNYPNPFNPSTTIEFAIPKSTFVTLKVYNLRGEEVATLVAEKLPAGKHQRVWEAKGLASGVYLYRLQAGEFVQTRKLALLR